jgi:hypothetical protein
MIAKKDRKTYFSGSFANVNGFGFSMAGNLFGYVGYAGFSLVFFVCAACIIFRLYYRKNRRKLSRDRLSKESERTGGKRTVGGIRHKSCFVDFIYMMRIDSTELSGRRDTFFGDCSSYNFVADASECLAKEKKKSKEIDRAVDEAVVERAVR